MKTRNLRMESAEKIKRDARIVKYYSDYYDAFVPGTIETVRIVDPKTMRDYTDDAIEFEAENVGLDPYDADPLTFG